VSNGTNLPPSFFDSMEHLPVHLAYEARIAGPVQYRWMYPFERYLRKLKNNVKNKSSVEGSIVNAYLVDEASTFSSFYFEDHVTTKGTTMARNDDGIDDETEKFSVFRNLGETFGRKENRTLEKDEFDAARIYVLLNCDEVQKYVR
jgi:Domain of unknown function (DUF4218)